MILKPDIPDLLKKAKTFDNNTRKIFGRANKPTKFKFVISEKDYRITEQDNSEHNIIFNTSPNRSSSKSNAHLLLSISKVVQKVVTTLKKKTAKKDPTVELQRILKPLVKLPLVVLH
jgi:hypothetical protein